MWWWWWCDPRRKWWSLLFSREDDIEWSLFARFGRGCWPIAETKRTDGGLELFPVGVDIDDGGPELFPRGFNRLGNVGGAVNVPGFGWKSEGSK